MIVGMEPFDTASERPAPGSTMLRAVVGLVAFLWGGTILLMTVIFKQSCFMGDCPRPGAFDSLLFWGVVKGTLLAVGVPVYMRRPTGEGLLQAAFAAAVVGALVMVVAAA